MEPSINEVREQLVHLRDNLPGIFIFLWYDIRSRELLHPVPKEAAQRMGFHQWIRPNCPLISVLQPVKDAGYVLDLGVCNGAEMPEPRVVIEAQVHEV